MSETYVLVHGAWHGGWAWRPVAEHLRAEGHRVITPTLPGLADGSDPAAHSLADVADALVALFEREDLRAVTLVAHSWGGYPVTGAVPRIADRLRKLVYWSAFVPSAGKSLADELPPEFAALFAQSARESGNNAALLPFEVWQQGFMQDAPESVQRLAWELMVPQPYQYFTETVEPLDLDSLKIPLTYLLSREDIALPPGEYGWARFAERLRVSPMDAPGSHEACFTQPAGLAKAILGA